MKLTTRRRSRRVHRLALLSVFLALPVSGCTTNLQLPYIEAMEATYEAIQRDVEHGLYKPDARSKTTLKKFDQANKDARAAYEANDKKVEAK